MSNYNIKQFTNFDIDESYTTGKIEGYTCYIIPHNVLIDKFNPRPDTTSIEIVKLGYCTNDNEGMNYPIGIMFDKSDGELEVFHIGKTGMFEFQPEYWQDINDDSIEGEAKVCVNQVWVPEGVPFVLDYCYIP